MENNDHNKIEELINENKKLRTELQKKETELFDFKNSRSYKLAIIIKKIYHKFKNSFSFVLRIARKINLIFVSQNELVSVVIPIYDRTEEVKESINSILQQTYSNIEVILVCDGSPEKTLKVVDSYFNNPKVRIYKFVNKSGNAVRGRNKGIHEAKGKYLAFQDSDDIAEIDRIKLSVEFIKKFNADVVYGGWRALMDGTRNIDGLKNGQEVYPIECDYDTLKDKYVPCQSTFMVKLSALRYVGGLKDCMRYREDHELWLRLAYFGYKFKAIPYILTNLRLHKNNLELQFKNNDEHWKNLLLKEHKIINRMKPKIGIIIGSAVHSGGTVVICKYANYLLSKMYDVTLITLNEEKNIMWYPNQKVNVINISDIENNYDIVVATFWTTEYIMEKLNAKRKIYLVQADERKFYEKNSDNYKKAEYTYTKNVEYLCIAQWMKNWLKQEFNKNATVISNGIDFDVLNKAFPLKQSNDKLRVLIEGEIDNPLKNVARAFEIISGLNCEVWCVSMKGKPKKDWQCDKFFENVSFGDMPGIYASCDVLLKTSMTESFCLPALEMMACSGISIVSKVDGINEFIIDGYNGYVFSQDDNETPRKILLKLINDKDLLKIMKENAVKTAKKWDWQNSMEKLEKFINK